MTVRPRNLPTHEPPDAHRKPPEVHSSTAALKSLLVPNLFKSHHVAHDLRDSKIEYLRNPIDFNRKDRANPAKPYPLPINESFVIFIRYSEA